MWVKLLGCSFIILSGTLIGFQCARKFELRVMQLQHLIVALTALESYIEHMAMPLTAALRLSVQGVTGTVNDLFMGTADQLEMERMQSFQEALEATWLRLDSKLSLQEQEREVLVTLAANLLVLNPQGYAAYFLVALEQIKSLEKQTAGRVLQNVKLFRYLGLCGSLVLVILLL